MKNTLMGNKGIICNHCGKPQCVVIPYAESDHVADMYRVAKRFLAAVEGHNQSPFDRFQVANYGRVKAEFMKVFEIKTVSEMLDEDDRL